MKKAKPLLMAIFAVIFVFAACMIGIELSRQKEEIDDFNDLAELVAVTIAPTDPGDGFTKPEKEETDAVIEASAATPVRNLSPLLEKNPDCIGWVYIADTAVDYPVMHTPGESEKYLRKNFYQEDSSAGVPFLEGRCTMECDNLILYAHNMKKGTMFADVTQYRKKKYYTEHPVIEFETAHGQKQYTVFAVVRVKSDDSWYSFHHAADETEYNNQVAQIKSRALYDTGITPPYGRQLITLSTCYGAANDDRIIVIGFDNCQ